MASAASARREDSLIASAFRVALDKARALQGDEPRRSPFPNACLLFNVTDGTVLASCTTDARDVVTAFVHELADGQHDLPPALVQHEPKDVAVAIVSLLPPAPENLAVIEAVRARPGMEWMHTNGILPLFPHFDRPPEPVGADINPLCPAEDREVICRLRAEALHSFYAAAVAWTHPGRCFGRVFDFLALDRRPLLSTVAATEEAPIWRAAFEQLCLRCGKDTVIVALEDYDLVPNVPRGPRVVRLSAAGPALPAPLLRDLGSADCAIRGIVFAGYSAYALYRAAFPHDPLRCDVRQVIEVVDAVNLAAAALPISVPVDLGGCAWLRAGEVCVTDTLLECVFYVFPTRVARQLFVESGAV